MGLMTAALLGGAFLLGKKMQPKDKAATPPLAPGPTTASIGTPTPPQIVPGADQMQAQLAGERQRKRTAQASLLSKPVLKSSIPTSKPKIKPKALIGY
jgi:hypothetical protein